jgi:hypothetical protein
MLSYLLWALKIYWQADYLYYLTSKAVQASKIGCNIGQSLVKQYQYIPETVWLNNNRRNTLQDLLNDNKNNIFTANRSAESYL